MTREVNFYFANRTSSNAIEILTGRIPDLSSNQPMYTDLK